MRRTCPMPLRATVAAACLLAAGTTPLGAATRTWDGGGPGNSWNSMNTDIFSPDFGATNWNGTTVIAANGDSLVFAGSKRLSNTNSHLSSVANLSFAAGAGAFTLGGDGLGVTGVISNLSSNLQTIDLPITVGATGTTWDGGSKGIQFNGGLSLGNNFLTLGRNLAINHAGSELVVGDSGSAGLLLRDGSSLTGLRTYIGNGSNGVGAVSLSSGARLSATEVVVGLSGNGSLRVGSGSTADTEYARVGYLAGSTGTVEVDGDGASWAAETLSIGSDSSVQIRRGGTLTSDLAYLGFGNSSLTVADARSQWTVRLLSVGYSGTGQLLVDEGGSVYGDNATLGESGGTGTATVSGTDSGWTVFSLLTVGKSGAGVLDVRNGGVVNTYATFIGQSAQGNGTVNVSTGARFSAASQLIVGLDGTGTLNILSGGRIETYMLSIGPQGVVNLKGGELVFMNQGRYLQIPTSSDFRWTSGALTYRGPANLARSLILSEGKVLTVASTLAISPGASLLLEGGLLSSGSLTLEGGSILSTGAINISDIGGLSGHGTVSGAVNGGGDKGSPGGVDKSITASGGTLTLGHAGIGGGYDFGGTLNLGGHQVVLLSADAAQLGVLTTLGAGARLSTVNGASLGRGETLSFSGNASIDGDFSHDGTISGSGGALTFLDDVSGAGRFAGDIVFKGAYRPGNSPAAVSFGGGDVTYDAVSVLTLEIDGGTPGTQHDQLRDIGTLSFEGTLNLVFGAGFAPADGQRFALFDFDAFSGGFGPERIQVSGFDRDRLDFSQLASHGLLTVAAPVPEPGQGVLLLAGLGLTGWVARRRLGAPMPAGKAQARGGAGPLVW